MVLCKRNGSDNGQRHIFRYILETELAALWSVAWESLALWEREKREKLRMASRGLVWVISFEGLDRHLFNPLHKLLRLKTDDKNLSFETLSSLPKL